MPSIELWYPSSVRRGEEPSQSSGSSAPFWVVLSAGLIREFFVDALGSLVGVLFTLAVCALVIASGTCFLAIFDPIPPSVATLGRILTGQTSKFDAWIFFIVAYVVGVLFRRQDPGLPDQASIRWVLRGSLVSELTRSAVQETKISRSLEKSQLKSPRGWFFSACDSLARRSSSRVGLNKAAAIAASPAASYPYLHMKAYLDARGLGHLSRIVPWNDDEETSGHRTKMFINILKIRIQLVAPAKCGEIVRNEAHVRMISSLWYAARAVLRACWTSLLPMFVSESWFWTSHSRRIALGSVVSHETLIYFSLLSFAVASAYWFKWHVESCIHYQRIREVVYVLETAFSVAESGHQEILENLPTA